MARDTAIAHLVPWGSPSVDLRPFRHDRFARQASPTGGQQDEVARLCPRRPSSTV